MARGGNTGWSKYIEASLSLILAVVSILVAVLSVLSLHNVSRARSEEDTHLTKDEWYEIGQAADYTAIIAAPVSLLVCVLYAIVRLLENTKLTENMPDTLVRLTSLLVGGATVAAFGAAGGLGATAVAHKLINYELKTVVMAFIAFTIGAALKFFELILLVRKKIKQSRYRNASPFL